MKLPLSIEKLRQMDEVTANEIDMQLDSLVRDLHGRPLVKKARKLTITISMTPVAGELNGRAVLADSSVKISVKPSMPIAESRVHTLAPSKTNRGELIFQSADPDNPRQGAFDDVAEDNGGDHDDHDDGGSGETIPMNRTGTV